MRVRWEDVALRVYLDGVEAGKFASVNIQFDENIEIDKAKYQGESSPRIDGHYNGVTGTVEFRLETGFGDPDEIYETHKARIRDREPGGVIRLNVSRKTADGAGRKAYRIDNAVIQTASHNASENQPWSYRWTFEADRAEVIV